MEQELLTIDDLDKAVAELDLSRAELLAEPYNFTNRNGTYCAPFAIAERLTQHCCRRFPNAVLDWVEKKERALGQAIVKGYYVSPGKSEIAFDITRARAEEWLREEEPIYRQMQVWCGEGALTEFNELLLLREEVRRLRELLKSAASILEGAGRKSQASKLLKELVRV
jgi:hypothetical protein